MRKERSLLKIYSGTCRRILKLGEMNEMKDFNDKAIVNLVVLFVSFSSVFNINIITSLEDLGAAT